MRLIVVFIVALVLAVGFWLSFTPQPKPLTPIMCPMDAMLCPDGTSVGRLPPDCAFAACPSPKQ